MSADMENYDLETYNEENVMDKSTKKVGKRRYYPSNKQQTYIRNAVTGEKYNYMVGSYDQRRFYKMVDTTGTCDSDGFIIKSNNDLPNLNPNHLYYDSPEQCMSHLRISIQPTEIAQWRDRTSIFKIE
jgi:hypothetical protein